MYVCLLPSYQAILIGDLHIVRLSSYVIATRTTAQPVRFLVCMDISSANVNGAGQVLPEILGSGEDRRRYPSSRGGGHPSSSDVFSVYLAGGPQYRLGNETY